MRRTLVRSPYLTQSQAIFAEFDRIRLPAPARKKYAIDQLVRVLIGLRVWDKMTLLYVFQMHAKEACYVNWKQPGTYTLTTSSGGMNFVQDYGLHGSGGFNGWLVNGASYSTFITQQDDNHAAWYGAGSNAFGSGYPWGIENVGDTFRGGVALGTKVAFFRNCQATTVNTAAQALSAGYWTGTRRGAAELEFYYNGASIGTSTEASSGAASGAVQIGRDNGVTTPFEHIYQMGHLGLGLTDEEVRSIYHAYNTYRTTLLRT
jgi:hypothetical protein